MKALVFGLPPDQHQKEQGQGGDELDARLASLPFGLRDDGVPTLLALLPRELHEVRVALAFVERVFDGVPLLLRPVSDSGR